jgi:hypothetical protein
MLKRVRFYALGTTLVLLAVSALAGGTYFRGGTAHAAAGGNNPHVLSRNFLVTHHAKAGYGKLPKQARAKVNISKIAHSHGITNGIPGIKGVSNWNGTFSEPGFDAFGNPNSTWIYNMLGNYPQAGGTTTIDSPIIPVKVELLGSNGKPTYTIDPKKEVQPTLKSPIFSNTTYDSSPKPTQYADAVQRAEFHNVETNNWHTMLAPSVRTEVTLQLPFGDWYVALNTDGSVAFTLVDEDTFTNEMFPATPSDLSSTVMGRLELNGTSTTKNISTFLFDNVYLYYLTPDQCCTLGFHGPDVEAGKNNIWNNYDMIYASWVTPGIFDGGVSDITVLSHEMAETYNDPFGGAYFPYAYVPWWFSGPDPSFTECGPIMEVGDVVEVYSQSNVVPITMNGMTYHPQTVALLQWFEDQTPSTAINGAYSYPNETFLTSAAVSMQPDCTGPA